ncbi:uncharacterized protein LOC129596215 [Paramacrobiotus metropolitanus]|uniref:uncharacterized protein LOC129596215 n=1 Tax=Paramacrobiotus metropolitanus TaxID=2943436 RepID=UPI002445B06F|nr:uncharacterized protein LOC129596215 [Paramacrobiotus metropolitanus]
MAAKLLLLMFLVSSITAQAPSSISGVPVAQPGVHPPQPSSFLTQPNPNIPLGPMGTPLVPVAQPTAPAATPNNPFAQPAVFTNPAAVPSSSILTNPTFPAAPAPAVVGPTFPVAPAPQPGAIPTNPAVPAPPVFFPSVPAPQPSVPAAPGVQPSAPVNPAVPAPGVQPAPGVIPPTNPNVPQPSVVVNPANPGAQPAFPGVLINPNPANPSVPVPGPVFPNPAPPANQPGRPAVPVAQPTVPATPGVPTPTAPGQPGVQTPAAHQEQTINQISTATAEFITTLDFAQIVSFLRIMLLNQALGGGGSARPGTWSGASAGAGGRPNGLTVHVEGYGTELAAGGTPSPLMQMTLFKGPQGLRMTQMAKELQNSDFGKYVTGIHEYWKSAPENLRDQYRPGILKDIDSLNVTPKIKNAIQELLPGLTLGKNPAGVAA